MSQVPEVKDPVEAALERGFHIIPTVKGTNMPIFADWKRRTTDDINVVDEWQEEYPDCELAAVKNGTIVQIIYGNSAEAEMAQEINRTDTGNAMRLIKEFGPRIRFVLEENRWYVFNGKIWREDLQDVEMHKLMGEALLRSRTEDKELTKFLIQSESHGKKHGAIMQARSLPGIAISKERFDQRRYFINLQNCALRFDVNTGEVSRDLHNSADMATKLMPVVYDEDARCPKFEAFMEWMLPNAETRRYVQLLLSLSLIGVVDRAIPIFFGNGKNGKSTLIQVLGGLMAQPADATPSASYYVQTSMATFTIGKQAEGGDKARPDLKRLAGARIIAAAETNAVGGTPTLDIAILKGWTGGEKISARSLYSNDLAPFQPQGVLLFATNNKPKISDDSDGAWDRIKLIPCVQTVGESDRVLDFHLKLLEEKAGIVNWLIDGLRGFMADKNPKTPAEVSAATAEYREADDEIRAFLADEGIESADPNAETKAKEVYALYKEVAGKAAIAKSDFNEWFRKNKRLIKKESGYFLKGIKPVASRFGAAAPANRDEYAAG